MRQIPTTLKNRIEKAFQTIHNNADPKMRAFVQRVYQHLQDGDMLSPITIRTGGNLGSLDVTVRRTDPNELGEKLVMLYVDNNEGKVAESRSVVVQPTGRKWTDVGEIGEAVDVAVEYNGYWERTKVDPMEHGILPRWALVTEGDPWFFRLLADGSVVARQGMEGADSTLVADNVTQICALRGWKAVRNPEDDQGIVLLYIRNGDVYYRSYAQQSDESWIWESEQPVAEFDTTTYSADNIALFRTNDYRLGLLAEINGQIYLALTERNWAGMGIPEEILGVDLAVDVDVAGIAYLSGYSSETLGVNMEALSLLWSDEVAAENFEYNDNWGLRIKVNAHPDLSPRVGQEDAFTVTDENLVDFGVNATSAGTEDNQIILEMADFNSAVGDITVTYDSGVGTMELVSNLQMKDFTAVFTPEGLFADPPEVEVITNE